MGKEFGASLVLDNQCLRAAGCAADLSFAKDHALAIHDPIDLETWNSRNTCTDFRDWALGHLRADVQDIDALVASLSRWHR